MRKIYTQFDLERFVRWMKEELQTKKHKYNYIF